MKFSKCPFEFLVALVLASALPATAASDSPPVSATSESSREAIPFSQEGKTTGELAWRGLTSLALTLLAGAGVVVLVRRKLSGTTPSMPADLKVVQVKKMDGKRNLVIVEWNGAQHLLAVSDASMVVIASAPHQNAAGGERQERDA